MKRLLLALAILVPASAWAGPAKVQCVTGSWVSGTTFTASLTATTGNFIYAYAWQFNTAAVTVSSVGDATNGNYTQIDVDGFVPANTFRNATFYKANITGGALTVTTTMSSTPSTGFTGSVVCEFSGVKQTSPLDQHNFQLQNAPGTGSNLVTSPSVTTTHGGELIIGTVMSGPSGTTGFSPGTGFSTLQLCASNANCDEYALQASPGAIAATATASNSGASDTFMTFIATFQSANSAGGPGSLTLIGVGK